ncbi:MAG: hypothetical protein WAN52_16820, partial [Pseudolabrys sp.]
VYVLGSVTAEFVKKERLAPFDLGERSQVLGDEKDGKDPGTRCCDRPKTREPERDCIRLRSVG